MGLPFGVVKCAFWQGDEGFSQSFGERAAAESDGELAVSLKGVFVGLLDEVCEADSDVVCVLE